jgi:tetratricopeptide (TPR) repeat protein
MDFSFIFNPSQEVHMKSISARIVMIICFLFAAPLCAQDAGAAGDLVAAGDTAFQKFDNQAAMESYQKALKTDPQCYEAAWKLARAYIDLGEKLTDKEQRKEYYMKAHETAKKAVEINPKAAKGHLYLGISLGRVALDAGGKEKVRLSKEIKSEVDKTLAIDPNDDIAWHVLALWNRNISTLSWIEKQFADIFLGGVPKEASVEKAVECLKKAIQIRSGHINHHLELGITYEVLDKKDLAIKEYEKVLELPISDADDKDHKAKAEKLLEKLK